MSSNAFASSRSRVRHQPTSRRRFVDHPRFIKLVQELARLNDVKNSKQQQQHQHQNQQIQEDDDNSGGGGGGGTTIQPAESICSANNSALNCTNTGFNQSQQQLTTNNNNNNNNASTLTHEERCPAKSSSALYPISKQQQHQHQLQQPLSIDQNNPDISNSTTNLNDHSSSTTTHINTNNIELNSITNNSNTNTNTSNSQQITNIAQDENRSKRKRSTVDISNSNYRKGSSSESGSSLGNNKKLKSSSTDSSRPLSPSFTKCPICLLDCMDRDPSFTNTCFHLFCYVCIENWSKNKSTCPLCRTKFTKIIFNIKSAKSFEEKLTIPVRRDDDDSFLTDRHFMLEHLNGMNSNTSSTARNNDPPEVQFIFEHFNRNPEVLMPPFFVNHLDQRPGEPIQFNASTSSANYNPNVPTNLAFTPNYSIPPNYAIALSFQQRIPPTSAIPSAYIANNNLTTPINDSNGRCIGRSSRYLYGSNGDVQTRVTRATSSNSNLDPSIVSHHNHQHSHLHPDVLHHHHQSHHNPNHQIQSTHQPQNNHQHHQHAHHHHHHHHTQHNHIHPTHVAAAQQLHQHQIQSHHQQTQTSFQPTNLRTTIEIAPRNARVIGVTQSSNLQVPQTHHRSFQNVFTRHRQAYNSGTPTQSEHPNNILDDIYRRSHLPDM